MTVGASRSAASSAARAKRGRKRVSRTRRPTRAYSSPACSLHEIESERRGGDRVDVQIKRIYEKPSRSDGFRVLVDRVWPRGVAKEAAAGPADLAAIEGKLRLLKRLFEEQLITEEEYAAKKAQLLDGL